MSFRLKTVFGVAVIEALLLLVLIVNGYRFFGEVNERHVRRYASDTAANFAAMTKDAVLGLDLARLQSFAEELAKHQETAYARIRDERGVTLAYSGSLRNEHQVFQPDDELALIDDGIFDAFALIEAGGRVFGRVELGIDVGYTRTVQQRVLGWSLGLAALEMMLVAVFSLVLGTVLARRLIRLEEGARRIADGELSLELPVSGTDELARTIRSFNVMSRQLLEDRKRQEEYALILRRKSEESAEQLVLIRQREEELAAEKERLAVTLRSIGDGVISTDTRGLVVFLNRVAEELTGWTRDEALGRPATEVFTIINEQSGAPCESPVDKVLTTGKIIGLANHTALVARDGTVRSIADSGAPIRDHTGAVFGVVLVFRDVTGEKKAEEEALKAQKLESVGVLAAGIAHDFNNILAAIQGNIDLGVRFLEQDRDRARALLGEAERAAGRAAGLTRQLLTFAKGGEPVRVCASLQGLIRESAEFVLHGSAVRCDLSFPDDLWTVAADVGQLGQVIQNLVLNARQAMKRGGAIDICCANTEAAAGEFSPALAAGPYVCIRVTDHGPGIPREIRDRIFDPYFTTKDGGSGLGLAVCHAIVAKHDGAITVRPTPGGGTTFCVYLPASGGAPDGVAVAKTAADHRRGARILVMDDEEMLRQLLAAMLGHLGHEVITVADGGAAIARYREQSADGAPIDLVIMDLTIPGGMGGKDAVRELLALDPDARVIVASGYSDDPVMSHAARYGFRAAVAKPFNLQALATAVDSVLSS